MVHIVKGTQAEKLKGGGGAGVGSRNSRTESQDTRHIALRKGDKFKVRNSSFCADSSTIILVSILFSMLGKQKFEKGEPPISV